MVVSFSENALQQYWQWVEENPKVFHKINNLIKDILRDPFKGIGKPEPLKWEWAGYWSRRITDEHRLVYKVENDQIIIASCKFHY